MNSTTLYQVTGPDTASSDGETSRPMPATRCRAASRRPVPTPTGSQWLRRSRLTAKKTRRTASILSAT